MKNEVHFLSCYCIFMLCTMCDIFFGVQSSFFLGGGGGGGGGEGGN